MRLKKTVKCKKCCEELSYWVIEPAKEAFTQPELCGLCGGPTVKSYAWGPDAPVGLAASLGIDYRHLSHGADFQLHLENLEAGFDMDSLLQDIFPHGSITVREPNRKLKR